MSREEQVALFMSSTRPIHIKVVLHMFIITKKQLLTFFEIIIALGILVAFLFSINSAFKID